ncbi:MAG: hypothetical protein COA99_10500 [Moraxellaceae bacterium]|nr:MAG: hypothetical protein COA99_10500 [Moraxellaceae bacterium]
MDTSNHYGMQTLFDQLGLPSNPDQIERFINSHQLDAKLRIEEAEFWTESQAMFLREAISDDSEWAEIVDNLDVGLR